MFETLWERTRKALGRNFVYPVKYIEHGISREFVLAIAEMRNLGTKNPIGGYKF
jgi:hypothetical protein